MRLDAAPSSPHAVDLIEKLLNYNTYQRALER